MKSDKSFIVIMAIIVAVIIGLLLYYFSDNSTGSIFTKGDGGNTINNTTPGHGGSNSGNNGNGNTTGGNSGNNSNNTIITLSSVDDYDIFFTINTIINEYYISQTTNDQTAVLNKLDSAYIKTHKITKSNVKNFMNQNYESISYFSKYMYVKGFNGIKYYFVNGETQSYDFADEILTEQTGINYLVTVDENNRTYSVTPIISSTNVFDYAQDYKMNTKSIESNDDNKYSKDKMEDDKIVIYYITYYKNILYLNTEKAYSMLTQESKNKYVDYETFVKNLETIYNNLSTNLLSYAAKGEAGSRKYSGIGMNQFRVDFEEKGIMDFKVDLTK